MSCCHCDCWWDDGRACCWCDRPTRIELPRWGLGRFLRSILGWLGHE